MIQSKTSGSSLVEACVVLAIVTAAALMATPGLARMRETYVLDSATHELAMRVREARMMAIARFRPCRLRVSGTLGQIECRQGSWATTGEFHVPAALTVTANIYPQFHPTGNAAPAGTITVRDARQVQRRIVVNPAGRIRIQ